MIESATFWKDGPEVATGEIVADQCRTEVFFLPAASHVEKEGTFTQTQRLLQWREKAVEPPGDCRSELWFFYHLGRLLRERLAGSTDDARPAGAATWPGTTPIARRRTPSRRRGGAAGDQRYRPGHRPTAVAAYTEMKDDGIDRVRLLDLLRRLRRRRQPGGPAQAPHRAGLGRPRSGAGRGRRTGASSTTGRRPTRRAARGASARRYVWWDAERGEWTGHDVPGLREDQAAGLPAARGCLGAGGHARRRPVHHAGRREGLAVRAAAGSSTVRCRRTTSRPSRRCATRCTASRRTRPARSTARPDNPVEPGAAGAAQRGVPVRVHHRPAHRAPHRRRHEPDAARTSRELQPEMFVEVSPELAARAGPDAPRLGARRHQPRTAIEARVLVTDRLAPLRVDGRVVHQVWLPYHWGSGGLVDRRLGQRPDRHHPRPERLHPGKQGRHLRHPAGRRPTGPGRCWTTSTATAGAPGRRPAAPRVRHRSPPRPASDTAIGPGTQERS